MTPRARRAMIRISDVSHASHLDSHLDSQIALANALVCRIQMCSHKMFIKELNTQEMKLRMKFTDLIMGLALLMVPAVAADGKLVFDLCHVYCVPRSPFFIRAVSMFETFPMVTLFANAYGTIEFAS
jgi:hypothetical protein